LIKPDSGGGGGGGGGGDSEQTLSSDMPYELTSMNSKRIL
jgi:hypothetical protein